MSAVVYMLFSLPLVYPIFILVAVGRLSGILNSLPSPRVTPLLQKPIFPPNSSVNASFFVNPQDCRNNKPSLSRSYDLILSQIFGVPLVYTLAARSFFFCFTMYTQKAPSVPSTHSQLPPLFILWFKVLAADAPCVSK